jgi:threonine synthase
VRYGRSGVPAGYESAATLAALVALREAGRVADGARVLLLNTGSHLIPLSKA